MPTKKQLQEKIDNMEAGYDCVASQMDYEEAQMKEVIEGGELPDCDERCMGCRFERFRVFTDMMRIHIRDRIKELEKENEKIKEIYEWNDEMDTDFIDSVKEREEIFKKYYDCPDIKEKYEELEKENEKLKEEIKNLKRETISREEHQKVCDFLNNEAEEYKKKYVDLIEK